MAVRQFSSESDTYSPCAVSSPGTQLFTRGSWIPFRGPWLKGNVLFFSHLELGSIHRALLSPRSPPSLAHRGPSVQCSAAEKTPPGHPANGPHRVCSRATLHVPCSLTVRGLFTASDLAPAPVGGGCLRLLGLPSPPPCGSHSRSQVSLADAPVSSEPDLSALKNNSVPGSKS